MTTGTKTTQSTGLHWARTTSARLMGVIVTLFVGILVYLFSVSGELTALREGQVWVNTAGRLRLLTVTSVLRVHQAATAGEAGLVGAQQGIVGGIDSFEGTLDVVVDGEPESGVELPVVEGLEARLADLQARRDSTYLPQLRSASTAASADDLVAMLPRVRAMADQQVADLDGAITIVTDAAAERVVRFQFFQLVFTFGTIVLLAVILWLTPRLVGQERASMMVAVQEIRIREILNSTADGIVTIDERGIVQSFNRAAERIFGYAAEEAVGQNVKLLMPSPYREEHDGYLERYHRTGVAGVIGRERILEGVRRDGSAFPLALRVSQGGEEGGGRVYIGTVQDITERRARETTIQEVAGLLASSSSEILAASLQQAVTIDEQAAAVAETMATVDEVTQAAEQSAERAGAVLEASKRTSQVGEAGREVVERSVVNMNRVSEQTGEVMDSISVLAEQAQAIGEIIATVNDIADQTNLLALNASIEAARAGEHGRGFAVVAGEVKSLAEQSKRSTGQVRQILSEIQRATAAAVSSGESAVRSVGETVQVVTQAGDAIRALMESLSESAGAASQISASAAQQAMGVGQVGQAMRDIEQAAVQNQAGMAQTRRAAEDLAGLSERLKGLLEQAAG